MRTPLSRLFGEKPPRLLVAGDLMLDRYVWGDVERISPEAPVQVLRWRGENEALGGAANVANNLAALGCKVRLLGLVGEDGEGARLIELARAAGLDVRHIRRLPGAPTVSKTRLIARSQHVLRVDKEADPPLPAGAEGTLLEALPEALEGVQGVICSDYLKGALSPEFTQNLLSAAKGRGLPVVVDPKDADYSKYRGALALTPNLAEVARATGLPIGSEEELDRAARRVLDQAGAEFVLVTRGAGGVTLFGRKGRIVHEPARAIEVFDVTGAGDTAAALFALALFGGAPPEEAARLANLGAGVVVGKIGTATVSPAELEAARSGRREGAGEKILEEADLLRRLHHERARGQKVVFTNGCFDLIHVGHIQYLQLARRLGDLLVVGVNDDASVRRLKGEGRPLIGGRQRAELLGALACVDFVVFFAEDTPQRLIEAIRPHVLVKGGDYTAEEIVGREIVEAYGGRVETLPLVEGISTTNLVETILQRYAPAREQT